MSFLRMFFHTSKYFFAGVVVTVFFASEACFAGLTLGLSGNQSQSHVGYETVTETTGSVNLSMDMGPMFRLGYTYKKDVDVKDGYSDITASDGSIVFVPFNDKKTVTSNSVDLTLVIYPGDTFVPFIFGGLVHKKYLRVVQTDTGRASAANDDIGPNGGIGLAINLSQSFSLKLMRSWSNGVTRLPNEEARSVLDSYTQISINYRIF